MMLVPADFSDVSTEPRAPDPSATMAITAATPITTPSMVRPVRSALRFNARMAIWALTRRKRSMVLRLGAWGLGLGAWGLGSIIRGAAPRSDRVARLVGPDT